MRGREPPQPRGRGPSPAGGPWLWASAQGSHGGPLSRYSGVRPFSLPPPSHTPSRCPPHQLPPVSLAPSLRRPPVLRSCSSPRSPLSLPLRLGSSRPRPCIVWRANVPSCSVWTGLLEKKPLSFPLSSRLGHLPPSTRPSFPASFLLLLPSPLFTPRPSLS